MAARWHRHCLPLTASSETRVNGEVTSFSAYGINLADVIATILFARWRDG